MAKSIILSGYFGFDNGGDEAVLCSQVEMLRETLPEADLVALSGAPERTVAANTEYALRAIDRRDTKAIKNELKNAALLISGGGSLFQDVTSVGSVYYYASILNLAHKAKVPAVVFAQGLGPLNTAIGRHLTKKAMAKCEFLSWRDVESQKFALKLGLPADKMMLLCDPVLNWQRGVVKKQSEPKRVLVALRPWQGLPVAEIIEALNQLKTEYTVELLPFQRSVDEALAAELNAGLAEPLPVIKYDSPQALIHEIAQADFVIGMRLHALIMAVSALTPCAAISYDPKVDSFAAQADLPVIGRVESLKASDIVAAVKANIGTEPAEKDYAAIFKEPLNRIAEIYHRG
jgi:polysaccharide pyruvyl transferase CsaB